MMEVEELFKGIAVIIDDEINDESSPIFNIRKLIEKRNIPVLTYAEIPSVEIIEALSNVSFIVLDWEYMGNSFQPDFSEERLVIPETLHDDTEEHLIKFIDGIINRIFVPTFIFTGHDSEKIKNKLIENNLWEEGKPNRIFIKQKSDLDSEEKLFTSIKEWLKEMPSVYVLKEWEKTFNKTKNEMFLDLYGYSPYWVKIVWDTLKADSVDNQAEFGEFVTRNFVNRIGEYKFDEECLDTEKTFSQKELQTVIEGERYIRYSSQPLQAYTGDLIKDGKNYYLNIRAQRDLARPNQQGEYNPTLYCVKGKKLKNKDIATDDIKITQDGKLSFGVGKEYTFDELKNICTDIEKLKKVNNKFRNHRNGIFFNKGDLLGKRPEIIIACIAGENAIKFDLKEIIPLPYKEYVDRRIGRLLPPYITKVQQNSSQYIVREGLMPVPEELYSDFGASDC